MATPTSTRTTRRIPTLGVAAGVVASAVLIGVSSPAQASVAPSGQLCFGVNGNPGDAAIVNLTPVGATARGNGQLISSDVSNNPPVASNTNFFPGSVDPNVAVAAIGNDGRVCYQNSVHTTVHLVADHLGTIAASAYTPATANGAPDRRVDTREEDPETPSPPDEPSVVRPQCAMPSTTRYDTRTAGTMFGLASRAYAIEPGVAVPGQTLEFPATSHFPDRMACWELRAALRGGHPGLGAVTDTEVIVARNVDTDDLVVSFRGTELNVVDILTDAGVVRGPWALPDGRVVSNAVHSGFGTAYLAVRNQLITVLRNEHRASGDGTRVYFTGHSLGGALATIGSIDLVDDLMALGYRRTEVVTYTYGAPRSLSRTMSNHHASFVPVSFAVVNPNDPVPHVPTAIGTSNPYSHIRNVTVLHGIDGTTNVRRNFGDGRNYGGCAHLIPDLGDHGRAEYNRRVGATRYYGPPTVWMTSYNDPIPFAIDNLRMHWNSPIEGPCDQVAMWNQRNRPTTLAGAIRDRWAILDTNDQHSTTVNVGDANWVGYVDMFGKVISSREY